MQMMAGMLVKYRYGLLRGASVINKSLRNCGDHKQMRWPGQSISELLLGVFINWSFRSKKLLKPNE